jgi:hypothetical protein
MIMQLRSLEYWTRQLHKSNLILDKLTKMPGTPIYMREMEESFNRFIQQKVANAQNLERIFNTGISCLFNN